MHIWLDYLCLRVRTTVRIQRQLLLTIIATANIDLGIRAQGQLLAVANGSTANNGEIWGVFVRQARSYNTLIASYLQVELRVIFRSQMFIYSTSS